MKIQILISRSSWANSYKKEILTKRPELQDIVIQTTKEGIEINVSGELKDNALEIFSRVCLL